MHTSNSNALVSARTVREAIETAIHKEPLYARMVESPTERRYLLDAIESMPLPTPIVGQLSVAYDRYPDLFDHMVCAAWVMVWFSCDRLSLKYDVAQAAAAGLLHDIGMIHLDSRLMEPAIPLDDTLRQQLYRHPLVTKALLERHHCFTRDMLQAVMEHHEAMDGSGYPRQLTGASISPMGRRLAMTEVMTAFLAKRHDSGELRLAVLFRLNRHRYDKALIQRVMALLEPANDERTAQVPVIDEPIAVLNRIAQHIEHWQEAAQAQDFGHGAAPPALLTLTAQIEQLKRNMAEAGLAPDQMAMLGRTDDDILIARELSLLALEANWQLNAIAQLAYRIWPTPQAGQAELAWPQWIDDAIALTAPLMAMMRHNNNAAEAVM